MNRHSVPDVLGGDAHIGDAGQWVERHVVSDAQAERVGPSMGFCIGQCSRELMQAESVSAQVSLAVGYVEGHQLGVLRSAQRVGCVSPADAQHCLGERIAAVDAHVQAQPARSIVRQGHAEMECVHASPSVGIDVLEVAVTRQP